MVRNFFSITIGWALLLNTCLLALISCSHQSEVEEKARIKFESQLTPHKNSPIRLPLAGPLSNKKAEVSGLTWLSGKWLVFLPENLVAPGQVNPFALYSLSLGELQESLSSGAQMPLMPKEIPVMNAEWIEKEIEGFDGFEAIVFRGDDGYLSIEARDQNKGSGQNMLSYIVKGKLKKKKNGDLSFVLNKNSLVSVPIMNHLDNFSCESLVLTENSLIAIYEANGKKLNGAKGAKAFQFDFNLKYQGTIPFPALNYRVTEASHMNAQGEFFALNYFWTGDRDLLKEPWDEKGKELILPLIFDKAKQSVELRKFPSYDIQDAAQESVGHNWEGMAYLDGNGFFIITDAYPETIFAFVPYRLE